MRTHLIVFAAVAAMLAAGGCASAVSMIDAGQALERVDQVNVDNWTKVRAVQLAFIDSQLAKLESGVAMKMATVTDDEAAIVFSQYQAIREQLVARRAAIEAEYGEALDNALLAVELRARQQQIVSSWGRLARRIPGVETLRAVAEAKARRRIEELSNERPRP